jgi:hypothetical protein
LDFLLYGIPIVLVVIALLMPIAVRVLDHRYDIEVLIPTSIMLAMGFGGLWLLESGQSAWHVDVLKYGAVVFLFIGVVLYFLSALGYPPFGHRREEGPSIYQHK